VLAYEQEGRAVRVRPPVIWGDLMARRRTQDDEAPRSRVARRAVLVVIALGLTAVLSGCSLASFGMSRPTSGHSGATSRKAPGPKAPATRTHSAAHSAVKAATTIRVVQGALATGSTIHRIDAGARTLLVNYWTTQNPATWTPDLDVPIHVSAHFGASGSKAAVLVTEFRATLGVNPGARTSTLRDDIGRFVLTAPFSYDSVVVLPGQPATARTATISVEFDLLIETAPGSHQYFRQTVLDTLPLTFVTQTRGISS
jgi:hypothetical protein